MRALRLFGLVLAVLAIHLAGWRLTVAALPDVAPAPAGVRWLEIVPGQGRGSEAAPLPEPGGLALAALPFGADLDGATIRSAASARAAPPVARAATASGRDAANDRRVADASPGYAPPTPDGAPAMPPAQVSPPVFRGDDGPARSRPASVATWPVVATRPPPSATLHYALQETGARPSGNAAPDPAGAAEIDWTNDAGGFALRVATASAGRAAREWRSVGAFDAAGLAPIRFAEREKGHDKRAINFDRDLQRVRFSGASQSLPFAPGVQDRWSWIAQLAAMAEAASQERDSATARRGSAALARRAALPGVAQPGARWQMQVAGLRGELDRWVFRVLPDSDLPPEARAESNVALTRAGRAPALLHVLREPERPYDLRIEAWLSPSLHHLPIGLRMSAPPGNWSLSLWPKAAGEPATSPGPTGAHPRDVAASGT